nr:hva22-like protein i [Quercus suber]
MYTANEIARVKAGDITILYWQKAVSFGQTKFFEILQYVSSQSASQYKSDKNILQILHQKQLGNLKTALLLQIGLPTPILTLETYRGLCTCCHASKNKGFQPVLLIIGFEPMTYRLLFKGRRSAKKEKVLSLLETVSHPT